MENDVKFFKFPSGHLKTVRGLKINKGERRMFVADNILINLFIYC